MELLYPILGIGALVFLGSLAWESFGRRRSPGASTAEAPAGMSFKAKPLLTDQEVQLYNLLRLAVEDRYLLFTQIPLWSLLDLRLPSGTPPAEMLRELGAQTRHLRAGASGQPFGREGGTSRAAGAG
jgi:hypothetical protein